MIIVSSFFTQKHILSKHKRAGHYQLTSKWRFAGGSMVSQNGVMPFHMGVMFWLEFKNS